MKVIHIYYRNLGFYLNICIAINSLYLKMLFLFFFYCNFFMGACAYAFKTFFVVLACPLIFFSASLPAFSLAPKQSQAMYVAYQKLFLHSGHHPDLPTKDCLAVWLGAQLELAYGCVSILLVWFIFI